VQSCHLRAAVPEGLTGEVTARLVPETINADPVAKQTNESSVVRRERSLPRGYILCPKKQKKIKEKKRGTRCSMAVILESREHRDIHFYCLHLSLPSY